MNLMCRKATTKDINYIYELCKEIIDKYENIQNIKYDKVLEWVYKKIENNIDEYKCIFFNNEKVGYYRFFQNGDMFELDDLYVLKNFQNQGIGTEIIKKCCLEVDCPIFLYVFIKNKKAISLYERLGFKVVDTIQNSRFVMKRS